VAMEGQRRPSTVLITLSDNAWALKPAYILFLEDDAWPVLGYDYAIQQLLHKDLSGREASFVCCIILHQTDGVTVTWASMTSRVCTQAGADAQEVRACSSARYL